jgi:peptidoglycan/LPS O-acetylase OafA/YrhL
VSGAALNGVCACTVTTDVAQANRSDHIVGLDGVRGIAALFVVVNHIFLRAWPGYPDDHAPFWAAGFIYGRFAVIVFIALSGFSLGLPAARSGWRLDSLTAFARRRAWRILPPYWAALAFSLAMTWYVLAQPGWPRPNAGSVAAYGLLVQDFAPNGSPNRAFWSIAIEAQLYLLLPLLLWLARRLGAVAMATCVTVIVVALGLSGPHVATVGTGLLDFTPDLAVLFAVGVLTSKIVVAGDRARSLPWASFAIGCAAPVLALIALRGTVWANDSLFWVDLAWTPAIACLLAALATSRPRPLVRLLDIHPLRSLGSFSYSLYLTHAPIVIAVSYGLVRGRVASGTPMFLVLCAILLPITIGFARLFAAVFEFPFRRHRSWRSLLARDHRVLAHPSGAHPVAPQLVRGEQIAEPLLPDLRDEFTAPVPERSK